MSDKPILTTTGGAPVPDNQNSISAGPRGPLLLQDYQLIEKLAHQNRERIPERVVHAKGAGAHGYFEVTNPNFKNFSKAKLFNQMGKRTPVFVRFSTVGGERGSADTARDPRGFAVIGADGVVAGTVRDVWVDRSEVLIRYLEVEVKGGKRVLLPMPFAKINQGKGTVKVESILGSQFASAPTLSSPDRITLLEEDKVVAYYGGGILYAEPSRQEPLL